MPKAKFTLITLDYPPNQGGVARYLGNLVDESDGEIAVVDASKLTRGAWPTWWPMVRACRCAEGVILVSQVFPVGTAAWVSRLMGGPEYVVIFHGLDVRLVRGVWKRWLLRRICAKAKALVANSEATKADVLKLVPGSRMTVMTPGIEKGKLPTKQEARRQLEIDPTEQVVLSIARLIPRKGIDVALRVMGRIQHQQPVSYVVIGDGADLGRLEEIAEESRTSVRWLRDAKDDEKWLWLCASDVFLLPVRDEGDDVEGFGIVFLEAAKAGIPSVAGKSGGAVEAVRNERTGLVVKPTDVDAVEQAVEKLLQDPELRQRLGDEGRQLEHDYRWEDRWKMLQSL
ncbi:MAG: glycosyltransferase family 4 protein [Patescibacteria group bacterium]